MVAPFGAEPELVVRSHDGTPIAVFAGGAGSGRPLLLIHGTAADHRTWRVVAPELAKERRVWAMDRRGRGASGDAAAYAAERELEDIAAVAEAIGPVSIVGHSLGGRLALAASPRLPTLRRVVAYEGTPLPGASGGPESTRLLAELRRDLARGDLDRLLARFMTEAVGMPADELAAFRANPIWPARARTAPTIVRELDAAAHEPVLGFEAIATTRVPVLQLVGGGSSRWFADGAAELDRRLADGRLQVMDGARHAAHHSHPEAFLAAVRAFVDED